MKSKLFLTMMLLLSVVGLARAQQALPYSYGFEDNDLSTDGWTANVTSTSSGINSGGPEHSGSYGFIFNYSEQNGSLISPLLTGGVYGVDVSFWYKEYSNYYGDEQFQVGYTTDETVTDASEFTYGAVITASTVWQEYSNSFPAGTKRIAIKYIYNDTFYLYLDDFSFVAASPYTRPANLSVANIGQTAATVSWEAPSTDVISYKYQYKPSGGSWTTLTNTTDLSVDLSGLNPGTTYTFQVQAIYSGGESEFASIDFTTDCPESLAIPYAYGFEDVNAIGCWTLSAPNNTFIDDQDPSFARSGNNFFFFNYTTEPPQYLISPQLSGIVNGLHVEFYYSQYTNGVETFQVGYSTTDNNPDNFTWGNEITASTSYQRFSANYPADTKYVAVKHTSNDQYYLFLDDFLFEESASVLEPTDVHVSNATTTSADISWTAGASETAWDIYVTDVETDVPVETTTPTVVNTSDKPYSLTGLTPATYYYVYVRANTGTETSAWSSPVKFNTKANPITLPYSYDFENDELPIGWSTIITNTSYTNASVMTPSNSSTNRVLAFYMGSSTGTLAAVLPEVDAAYPLKGYQISFDACYANVSGGNMTSGKLGIGIMTDPEDFTTFELIEEVDITDVFSTYGSHTVWLNGYTGTGQYIAIKNIYTQSGYVLVDNVAVTELPAVLPPTNVVVTGGKNAVVTWEGSADSYDVAFSTDGTSNPDEVIVAPAITVKEFDLSNYTAIGDNFVWVRSNSGSDHSSWVAISFNVGYCSPNATSHDSKGIIGVAFGTGTDVVDKNDTNGIPSSAPYYGDYTSEVGAIPAGVESTIAITTNTGSYPYTFVIWVDLDKSMSFEDNEILYVGKATSGSGTLNATITIPSTQALGDYRMRIYGADSYFNSFYNSGTPDFTKAHDPCADGTYRHVCDFTVRVTEKPACLAPTGLAAVATNNSAELSWTANNGESEWTVYYKKASDTDYTEVTGVTENPYTLNGLTASTAYEFYVVAHSGTDTSDPSSTCSFTTTVDPVNTFPWTENFNGLTEASSIPDGWDNSEGTVTGVAYKWCYNTNTSGNGAATGTSHDGSNCVRFNSYSAPNNQYNFLKTVPLALPNDPEMQLTFWYKNPAGGDFSVYISTDGGATHETALVTGLTGASSWTQADAINLSAYAGKTVIIVFKGTSNYGNGDAYIYLDDVTVEEVPACAAPSGLSVTNITTNSAELSWTANSGESDWTIYYKKVADTDYTEVPNVTENPYTLTGLAASTDYVFYVVAHKGTDTSAPSNTCNFTTDCDVFVVDAANSFFEGFEGTTFAPTCWTNISTVANGATRQWTRKTTYKHSGSASAYSGYYGDIYLKLPAMQIDGDAVLSFWSYNSYASDYDKNSVVLFDGSDEIELWTPDASEVTSKWVKTNIDLSAYDGQTISLAFKYEGNNAHEWYVDDVQIAVPANIILTDAGTDNAATIATNDRVFANVTLSGRTLYKDGSWNTICLPFELTLAGSPLDGATAKTLESVDQVGTSYKLNFGDAVTTLEAGKPYLIKWDKDDVNPTITDPVFPYVNIDATTDHTISPIADVKFIGYYDAFDIDTPANDDIYYMKSDNTLAHTGKPRTLKACRAYFQFSADVINNARSFVLNFGDDDVDDDVPTSISNLSEDLFGEGDWYTPSGIKVGDSIPVKKGVYIKNGKKVVIK